MAELQSCEDSLQKLATTVNQMLVETGRFFRSSGSMHSQAQLKRVLPAANEEFQTALDRLSEQIYLAKAVLEKDYEPIEREKAAQVASKAPFPPTQANGSQPPQTKLKEEEEDGGSATRLVNETQPLNSTDTVQPSAAGGASSDRLEDEAMMDWQDPANDSAPAPPTTAEPDPLTAMADAHGQNEVPVAASSQPLGEGANMGVSVDAGSPGLHIGLDPTDVTQDIGHHAFDSLLPGLESYANVGVEDPSNAIQQANRHLDTNPSGENKASGTDGGQEGGPEAQVEDMPPHESNFDDLFVGVGDFGDSEDLLKNVEIGEYDSWFT